MDSIQEHHSQETLSKIRSWIAINEYSAESSTDWCARVQEKYPWIECIQKGATEKGQARTMNLILERIRDAELWIHWEEAWEVRAPFLEDAYQAMKKDPGLTQVQFTFHNGTVNWMDIDSSRIHCTERICQIDPAADTHEICRRNSPYRLTKECFSSWPLYSLLPSINRAEYFQDLGTFSEDPKLWPIKFEWDFARRWFTAGGTKAVMRDGPVWRPGTHISTYAN